MEPRLLNLLIRSPSPSIITGPGNAHSTRNLRTSWLC